MSQCSPLLRWMRLFACLALVNMLAVLCSFTRSIHAADKPNFIVVMADDLGYADLSCYGSTRQQTPHIDRLAETGLKFTDFHSNGTVCSPTRAALLTGRYQQRSAIDGVVYAAPNRNRHHGLQVSEVTFAKRLKEAGYATAIVGKWHLGYERQYNPIHHGFDKFWGYVSGNVDFHSHIDGHGIFDWWEDDQLSYEEGYVTHLITKHAVDFIEEHKEVPFCLYVAHECPHYPYQGPQDGPERKRGDVDAFPKRKDIQKAYQEMMHEMDLGIGELTTALKKHGLEENTVVLFFSDNGANQHGENQPLRGRKGNVWEGGHRVPMIAHWPGKIKPGQTDQLALTMDIFPTLLELAQIDPPADRQLDGLSLAPTLLHQKSIERGPIVWDYNHQTAVRSGPWKLVLHRQGPLAGQPHLFNLDEDLAEETNLAKEHPAKVKRLHQAYTQWQAEIEQDKTTQPETPSEPVEREELREVE